MHQFSGRALELARQIYPKHSEMRVLGIIFLFDPYTYPKTGAHFSGVRSMNRRLVERDANKAVKHLVLLMLECNLKTTAELVALIPTEQGSQREG